MSGSLVASDVRGQFVGPEADVRALNPIVVFATDGDQRAQTKALKVCVVMEVHIFHHIPSLAPMPCIHAHVTAAAGTALEGKLPSRAMRSLKLLMDRALQAQIPER